MKAIIGKKVGMSQIFDENGHVIDVYKRQASASPKMIRQASRSSGDITRFRYSQAH